MLSLNYFTSKNRSWLFPSGRFPVLNVAKMDVFRDFLCLVSELSQQRRIQGGQEPFSVSNIWFNQKKGFMLLQCHIRWSALQPLPDLQGCAESKEHARSWLSMRILPKFSNALALSVMPMMLSQGFFFGRMPKIRPYSFLHFASYFYTQHISSYYHHCYTY